MVDLGASKEDGGYEPKSFWNARFSSAGHTGELNPMLYAYDQPRRLRAISRAITRAGVSIDSNSRILDFGCGTGDVIRKLTESYEPEITGIDISDQAIDYAKKQFASHNKVRLLTASVEDMDFPSFYFDLSIGINVLQHIANEKSFCRAIENVVKVTKDRGHILVMDFSPVSVTNHQPSSYVVYRSRGEYIDAFQRQGCILISEYGLPRIGVRLYRALNGARRVIPFGGFHKKRTVEISVSNRLQPERTVGQFVRALLLTVAKPLDYWLAPLPYRFTDMRILVFQVVPR